MEVRDAGRYGVDGLKVCDWKTTIEVNYCGCWCDVLFSTNAAAEPAVKQSRMLKAHTRTLNAAD